MIIFNTVFSIFGNHFLFIKPMTFGEASNEQTKLYI